MLWLFLGYMAIVQAQEPPAPEEQDSADEVEECKDNVTRLKNRMLGLQFYLQDKKDHEEFCPKVEWEQPTLEKYREAPKSKLPEGCKPEKEE